MENQQNCLATFTMTSVVGVALLLSACGSETGTSVSVEDKMPALTAMTLGQQSVLSTSEYMAQARFATADIENGARQAQICKACHSLEPDGPNMIGPALHGFFGRGVGMRDGFGFSAAAVNADFVWTPTALDAWLLQPSRFLPGNSMAFAGVMKQSDRDDLIAYLLEATSSSPAND